METLQSLIESDLPVEKVLHTVFESISYSIEQPTFTGRGAVLLTIVRVEDDSWFGSVRTKSGDVWNGQFAYGPHRGLPTLNVPHGVVPGGWEWGIGRTYESTIAYNDCVAALIRT